MRPLIERLAGELLEGLGVTAASVHHRELRTVAVAALVSVVLTWRRLARK